MRAVWLVGVTHPRVTAVSYGGSHGWYTYSLKMGVRNGGFGRGVGGDSRSIHVAIHIAIHMVIQYDTNNSRVFGLW